LITSEISPIFKSLVWDVLVKRYLSELFISLSIGPTSFLAVIITKIAMYFLERLYPIIEQTVKIGEIRLTNEIHQAAYQRAHLKLVILAKEKGIDSFEFKKQREIQHEKLADLVIYNIN